MKVELALAAAIGWMVWPYYGVYSFGKAIYEGNLDEVVQTVDWPALRHNLKDQIAKASDLEAKLNPERVGDDPGRFGAVMATSMLNGAIDAYVTPDGVKRIVANLKGFRDKIGPQSSAEPKRAFFDKLKDFNYSAIRWAFFTGPMTFRIDAAAPNFLEPGGSGELTSGLEFTWSGSWKLSGVHMPVDEVAASFRKKPEQKSQVAETVWNLFSPEPQRADTPERPPAAITPAPVSPTPQPAATFPVTRFAPVPPPAVVAVPAAPPSTSFMQMETIGEWKVGDGHDDAGQIYRGAGLYGATGDDTTFAALVMTCLNGEVGVSFMNDEPIDAPNGVTVSYQFDGGRRTTERWRLSDDGRQALPTDSVAFIRNLQGRRRLHIRVDAPYAPTTEISYELLGIGTVTQRLSERCPAKLAAR